MNKWTAKMVLWYLIINRHHFLIQVPSVKSKKHLPFSVLPSTAASVGKFLTRVRHIDSEKFGNTPGNWNHVHLWHWWPLYQVNLGYRNSCIVAVISSDTQKHTQFGQGNSFLVVWENLLSSDKFLLFALNLLTATLTDVSTLNYSLLCLENMQEASNWPSIGRGRGNSSLLAVRKAPSNFHAACLRVDLDSEI